MKALLLCLLVSCAIAGLGAASRDQKNINVELQAKWSGTPLILELSELLAKERSDLYWKFIESWHENEEIEAKQSPEGCFSEIVSRASTLLDGGPLASVLELSLVARTASPKLVLYRQLAIESLQANHGDSDRWTMSGNLPQGKCCWVDAGTDVLVDHGELTEWLKRTSSNELEVFEFDHVYPQFGAAPDRVAILYGALGTPCFRKMHETLRDAAKEGRVKYVVRPVLPPGCEASTCAKLGTGKPLKLSGYGIQLALKNMEYKAIDDSELHSDGATDDSKSEDLTQDVRGFIFSKLLDRKPQLESELMTFRDHLLSSDISDSLNVWELKDLGYQTAQRIVGASEPLRLMLELNQNFPKLVSSLSRMKINETIKEEIVANQQLVPPGRNLFAINGALVNPDNLDLFTLINMVQEEYSFADKLTKLKVPSAAISKLLQLPDAEAQSSTRLDFRSHEFVHYLNDIEEDEKYSRWRSNMNELLMPTFPGQMRYIRRNLYHAVYVIDPASLKELKVVQSLMHYYLNNVPMRFGLIFVSPKAISSIEKTGTLATMDKEDISNLIIKLFMYVEKEQGPEEAFQFLNQILEAHEDASEDNIEQSHVEEAFLESLSTMTKTDATKTMKEIMEREDYNNDAVKSSRFAHKLGLAKMHPTFLMNGLVYGPSQALTATLPITAMNEELQRLQERIYYGFIDPRADILNTFLSTEGIGRYNPKIISPGSSKTAKYVTLATPVTERNPVVTKLQYWHAPGTEDDVKAISHWIAVDLTQPSGVQLLKQGVDYLMQGTSQARLAVLHNVKSDPTEGSTESLLVKIVSHLANSPSRRAKHVPFLQSFLSQYTEGLSYEEVLELAIKTAEDVGLKAENLRSAAAKPAEVQFQEERNLLSSLFGLEPGSNAIVTNGRVLTEDNEPFFADDFKLLEGVEYKRRMSEIKEVIEDVTSWDGLEPDEITSEFLSTVLMVVSSTMSSRTRSSDSVKFELLRAEHGAIVREVDGSVFRIDAVIDPLSATGQKLSPLLLLLDDWLKPSIRIVLNPMSSLADVPLKNFYRYVLPSKDEFVSGGFGPFARFTNMPPTKTLTMNLDVPEPWLVEPVIAIHDLDNIVLEKLGNERTLQAVFELEALMITGHCYENSEPPRGLQLILGTKQVPHMVDTIVMANLGYFQLKAAPGAWTLSLADGRSSELYTLTGPKQGTDEGPISRKIAVADMRGELVHLEVTKRKGKENEKLLEAKESSRKSLPVSTVLEKLNVLKWIMGGKKTDGTMVSRQGETINIFSVASGHLYERFLKIMILSVLKNTNRPVKFWFIKNYLSPQFKDLIPHMATKYGFEYELVTYKWPSWLHKQTEKQRIIWAYKILFLDVIFPLSLKKVIFVDADQIIRTDMGELYDMDIKGKPLAYTPFCDNNKDMDGYRFWNQGFWREHLQGKPYHISALYVVDLDKFRQTAAGDNLRVLYESLSKDPNSLSNLDQDLPNYAQHMVPIFSLPQEWLWCESWCGNATKAKAKTIDLCNNPMTKEPKLQGARRIVKEWPALDEEARLFTKEILGNDVDHIAVASPPIQVDEVVNEDDISKDEL